MQDATLRANVTEPPEEPDLREAAAELELAIEALRRAQAMWTGKSLPISGKAWDVSAARGALDEAESRLNAARLRLETAAKTARRRELKNGL
jgi:hypothetical protein